MHRLIVLGIAAASLLSFTIITAAQNQPLAFEVASIKPHLASDRRPTAVITRGSRILLTNYTLRGLVLLAYSPRTEPMLDQFLAGSPAWAATDRFDIEAKASEGSITKEQLNLMLQTLLSDRFQLSLHRELREIPVYDLVVRNPGKMKLSGDQSAPVLPPLSASVRWSAELGRNRGVLRAWLLTPRAFRCMVQQCRCPQSPRFYRRSWTDQLLIRQG